MKNIENYAFLTHSQIHYEPSRTTIFEHQRSLKLIGISVLNIYRQIKKETFPIKDKLSTQRFGFLKYQIDLWIDEKRINW